MPEPIVTLNEEPLKSGLRELVRRTVEDTLNGLLEEEAGDTSSAPSATGAPPGAGRAAPGTTTGARPRRPARSRSICPSSRA